MDLPNLLTLFESLSRPPASTHHSGFSAHPILGVPACRIGKDGLGRPSILTNHDSSYCSRTTLPIRLQNIEVQPDMHCEIVGRDGTSTHQKLTVIRCLSDDPGLQVQFLRLAAPLVSTFGHEPSPDEITAMVESLVRLFTKMNAVPQKSVQGLWGELLIIALSPNPEPLLLAWHADPDEKYDFNAGQFRLEVKTSSTRQRRHNFSFEQLNPPPETQLVIVSLFVQRSGGGPSIKQLIDNISTKVAFKPHLITRLNEAVHAMLGSAWHQAFSESFDFELARESLCFYCSDDIPKITLPLPSQVTDVRFCSDLSLCSPTAPHQLKSASAGLFRAIASLRKTLCEPDKLRVL